MDLPVSGGHRPEAYDCTSRTDERRTLELRLNEMRAYEGFICQIEMSFDHAQRTYVFDIRTDWFEELNNLIERMEDFFRSGETPWRIERNLLITGLLNTFAKPACYSGQTIKTEDLSVTYSG